MPNLQEQILNTVDETAARRRYAAVYISQLIMDEEPLFRQVFKADELAEEQVPMHLFDRTNETIKNLTNDFVAPFGVRLRYMPRTEKGEDTPAVAIGWANYILGTKTHAGDSAEKSLPHILWVNEKGQAIIDEYRRRLGFVTLQAQRTINFQRHEDALDRLSMV